MFSNAWKKRQRQALAEQYTASRSNYDSILGGKGADEANRRVIPIVLSHLKVYLYETDLMLSPEDNLQWLIGIDGDEVTDVFERIVVALGCQLPSKQTLLPNMSTVDDLVKGVIAYCAS